MVWKYSYKLGNERLKYVFHIQKDIAGEEGHTVFVNYTKRNNS